MALSGAMALSMAMALSGAMALSMATALSGAMGMAPTLGGLLYHDKPACEAPDVSAASIVQDDAQKRAVDRKRAVTLDKPELPEPLHQEVHV